MLKNSYSQKIIVSFVVVNLCGVLISGLVSYNMNKQVLLENYSLIVNDYTNQMTFYASGRMEKVQSIAESFIFDDQFHYIVGQNYNPYESYSILSKQILPKGNSAVKSFGSAMNASLYLHNETINEHYYVKDGVLNEESSSFNVKRIDKLGDDPIVEAMRETGKYIIWTQTQQNKEDKTVSLYARLINFSNMHEDGILILVFKTSDLFMSSDSGSSPVISFEITGEGIAIQKLSFDITNADDCMIIEKDIRIKGFKLRSYTRKSDFYPQMWKSTVELFLVSLASFLVMLLLGFGFKRFLYKDVSHILRGIKKIQNGGNCHLSEGIKNNEFQQIALALDNYVESVDSLINDVYEIEIQRQDIEFSMLQAKINPHFLYNIFAIMNELAKAGLNESVISVLGKTAAFYRQTLSKNTGDHTLDKEINDVNTYMDIIRVIKPNEVSISYEVTDIALQAYVPRFLIQPIVENAVKHAINENKLMIIVRADVSEDTLRIKVEDNGIGMTAEQVEQYTRYRDKDGYGIYNIIMRLKLKYPKPEYGLNVQSQQGRGTIVEFVLPYITEYSDGDLDV